jgi:hypothetical protein
MKTARSSKRKAAHRPVPRGKWWLKEMETLTATMQERLEKMREGKASPMRTAVGLLHAEVKTGAAKLGFDTSKVDWRKLLSEEANSYPHTQEGIDEEFWRRIPTGARARIRALELIDWLTHIAKDLEPHIQDTENWLAELRSVLEADPAPMPPPTLIQQIAEYDPEVDF